MRLFLLKIHHLKLHIIFEHCAYLLIEKETLFTEDIESILGPRPFPIDDSYEAQSKSGLPQKKSVLPIDLQKFWQDKF